MVMNELHKKNKINNSNNKKISLAKETAEFSEKIALIKQIET